MIYYLSKEKFLRIFFIYLIVCFLFAFSVNAECISKGLTCTLRFEKVFEVYNQNNRQSIYVRIFSVTHPKGSPWQNTDEVLIIKNSEGKELLTKSYNGPNEERIKFYVYEKVLSSSSNALLIIREDIPSAPLTGIEGQLFSINKSNDFVAISGIISPSSDNTDQGVFRISKKKIDGKDDLIIESDFWNGNFFVTYYYPISFDSNTSDLSKHIELKNYPIKIDNNQVSKYRKIFLKRKKTIFLYPEPGASKESKKKLKIDINSKIKFIDAANFDNKWWLRIEVGGLKGYVKGSKTFARLGLPSAG